MGNNTTENGIFSRKKVLWDSAFELLCQKYGQMPPIEILNRFESERAEFADTDLIVYIRLFSQMADEAYENNHHILIKGNLGSSFVSYIAGATGINPLPPHYYCPQCKKVEFVKAADGWDLPPKKCVCGEQMQRDGHNIPYQSMRKLVNPPMSFDINFDEGFKETVIKMIDQYFNGCTLVYIDDPQDIIRLTYVLPGEIDGIKSGSVLSSDEYHEKIRKFPRVNIMTSDMLNNLRILEQKTGVCPSEEDIMQADILEQFRDANTDGIPDYETNSAKDILRAVRPSCFSELLKVDGLLHGTGCWSEKIKHSLENGELSTNDLIAFREEVFNEIESKSQNISGFAYNVMENTRLGRYSNGIDFATINTLRTLGLSEQFISLLTEIKYLFPKAHCVSYVKNALTYMWYKVHYKNEFMLLNTAKTYL